MPNQYTVGDDVPWKDKEKLADAYYDSRTTEEVADKWGCAPSTIYRWVDKFDLERREKYGGPWTDREKMMELYWGERMSQEEIAEHVGCEQSTLSTWFDRLDIPTRYLEKKHGSLSTTERGYVYFAGVSDIVWMHKLAAIAGGANPEKVFSEDYNIHHINDVQWDNRPENVECLTVAEHTERHREELLRARWED